MLAGLTVTILLAVAADPPAKETVRLNYKEKPFKEVLAAVAKPLGLTLQIDFDPPGTFTYTEPTELAPEKALEIVHGSLLDRGITLIRQGNLLVAIRLAENLHQTLTAFSPMEEIVLRRDNLPVFTVVKLNSLNGSQAKTELANLLSPRGKIAETGVYNRVAVWDRCDCVREFIRLLAVIDPPGKNNAGNLLVRRLQYARAHDALVVLSKLLAVPQTPQQGPQMPPGIPFRPPDFAQMGAALGEKRIVQAFAPGINIDRAVPGQTIGSSGAGPTEIEIDETRNMLFVRADRDKLAIAERVLETLDRPSFSETGDSNEIIEVQTWQLRDNNGQKVAAALRDTFAGTTGFYAEGAENRLFVRAPKRRMVEVKATLARQTRAQDEFVVLTVPAGSAKQLAKQFSSLFHGEPEASRPAIAADSSGDRIIVRGTQKQVSMIRGLARDVTPQGFVDHATPTPKAPDL